MGQYPVISLSLKSAKQPSFEMAYASILDELALEFDRHKSILNSNELSEDEKALYKKFIKRQASEWESFKGLKFLSNCLQKVYQKNVIILLDEYDVLLENAWFRGFYEQMTDFIRSLFESALKTNPSLEFAVITGCLRISRESIFTGLNSLEIISVLSNRYSEHFGFTVPEVEDILCFYNIEGKRWYDGYFFGNTEVYNP
ncbi:AAA family ATPase [Eisenbergiella porci]|uniref:AAA family ATPase n=1 Tax=Eisenbergiella porci TaxID=2652274 RepID=UPI002A819219|nr:AAA family ATPase [Eisenbergiella porci]